MIGSWKFNYMEGKNYAMWKMDPHPWDGHDPPRRDGEEYAQIWAWNHVGMIYQMGAWILGVG